MPKNLPYYDIHTHTRYSDDEAVLLINVFPDDLSLSEVPGYYSIGLHPWHADASDREHKMDIIRRQISKPHVIAIGETGLDKIANPNYSLQQDVFEKHLAIASMAHKPVIIHCVRAYSEMLAYRAKSDLTIPWIFHWFNAHHQMAEQLIRKNCYLSFGKMLFEEKSKALQVFASIDLERVFFETDDTGYSIRDIYTRASEIRNTSVEALKSQIMHNFVRCFHPL
jgi:TatD DNase family protein